MARVKYLQLPKHGRILAISDIHGNLPYFRGLLYKLRFSKDDVLLLLGDMVEKGGESLATLRTVMELTRTHNVHALLGNCDGWFMQNGPDAPWSAAAIRRYICSQRRDRGPGLLAQMCAELGIALTEDMDIPAMRRALEARFGPELRFLRSLPHIIETEHYTFVHGGLPEDGPLEALDAGRCMKNDAFLTQGKRFRKWVIVGHWPVMLYREDICSAGPIIDHGRKIASIDGGCVLKSDGQLNALIIPRDGSEDFLYEYFDPFPVYRVLDAQAGSERSAYIRWGDNAVEILSPGTEFTRCRHLRTGYEMDILTKYLSGDGGAVRCADSTDYELPLQPGDEVSLVEETSRGYLVKHRGVTGWYRGRLI